MTSMTITRSAPSQYFDNNLYNLPEYISPIGFTQTTSTQPLENTSHNFRRDLPPEIYFCLFILTRFIAIASRSKTAYYNLSLKDIPQILPIPLFLAYISTFPQTPSYPSPIRIYLVLSLIWLIMEDIFPAEEQQSKKEFQDLPLEIRIKIWKYALPEPRLVRFSQKLSREHLSHMEQNLERWPECSRMASSAYSDSVDAHFTFYDTSSNLIEGSFTTPQKSPLRLACKESLKVWEEQYKVPRINFSQSFQDRWRSSAKFTRVDDCKKWFFYVENPENRRRCQVKHGHIACVHKSGREINFNITGLLDMERDTLIVDPILYSLIKRRYGFEIDISRLRSIAYMTSLEYDEPWGASDRVDGFDSQQHGMEYLFQEMNLDHSFRDMSIEEELPPEVKREAQLESRYLHHIWLTITEACPMISRIHPILFGERNTAIYMDGEEFDEHDLRLLPLSSSVQKLILHPKYTPRMSRFDPRPISGIHEYMTIKLGSVKEREAMFRVFLKDFEHSGNERLWKRLGKASAFQVCALADIIETPTIDHGWPMDHWSIMEKSMLNFVDLDQEDQPLHIGIGLYLHCDANGTPTHNIYSGMQGIFVRAERESFRADSALQANKYSGLSEMFSIPEREESPLDTDQTFPEHDHSISNLNGHFLIHGRSFPNRKTNRRRSDSSVSPLSNPHAKRQRRL